MQNFLASDYMGRAQGLGGSDAAAALGENPYKTRFQLFEEKTGKRLLLNQDKNVSIRVGIQLEPVAAEMYSELTGESLTHIETSVWHPEHSWMYAHVDRFVNNPESDSFQKILEIKTSRNSKRWGEPGTAEVPKEVFFQCLHNLAVTGADVCDVPVIFLDKGQFSVFTVKRNDDIIRDLIEAERRFWFEHVLQNIPPDPSTLDDLKLRYPHSDGSAKIANKSIRLTFDEYKARKDKIALLEKEAESLLLGIKSYMGDSESLEDGTGNRLATWRPYEVRRFDSTSFSKKHPDLYSEFSRTDTSRAFRVCLAGGAR